MNENMNEFQEMGWLDLIDKAKLDIHPLQFANVQRFRENDATFIFDEVGCGKTISALLMALDCLWQQRDLNPEEIKKVLIITITDHRDSGYFIKEWKEKFPYKINDMDFINYVEVKNHNHGSFKEKKHYGLVIIDEAHKFLNHNNQNVQNLLNNTSTEKVVFLTATPIKDQGESDLNKLKALWNPNLEISWDKLFHSENETDMLCASFDTSSPVTRNMKDILRILEQKAKTQKSGRSGQDSSDSQDSPDSQRNFPSLWWYPPSEKKIAALHRYIAEILENTPTDLSKFVVFVSKKEDEAYPIRDFLQEKGLAVTCVTGDGVTGNTLITPEEGGNTSHLTPYTCKNSDILPQVLIVTYQLATEGVNLPGFSHVVNYNIPPDCASLEQRFGRIDRLDSCFQELNICFLLSGEQMEGTSWVPNLWDTNTKNFWKCKDSFEKEVAPILPSKNILLTAEMIRQSQDDHQWMKNLIIQLNQFIQNPEKAFSLLQEDMAQNQNSYYFRNIFSVSEIDTAEKLLQSMKEFVREHEALPSDEAIKELESILTDEIDQRHNHIFYEYKKGVDGGNTFTSITAQRCAEILDSEEGSQTAYQAYAEQLFSKINRKNKFFPHKDKECRQLMNDYFVERFMENDFDSLFPHEGYRDEFKAMLWGDEFWNILKDFPEEQTYFMDNCDNVVQTLPFFQFVNQWKESLENWKDESKKGQSNDVLYRIFGRFFHHFSDDFLFCFSNDFKNEPFLKILSSDNVLNGLQNTAFIKDTFSLKIDENGKVVAGKWLKLLFEASRNITFSNFTTLNNDEKMALGKNTNYFFYKEKYFDLKGYFHFREKILNDLNQVNQTNDPEKINPILSYVALLFQPLPNVVRFYSNPRPTLDTYAFETSKFLCQSIVFGTLLDRNNTAFQAMFDQTVLNAILEKSSDTSHNFKKYDYWTQGILYCQLNHREKGIYSTWGDFLPYLPENCKMIPVFPSKEI